MTGGSQAGIGKAGAARKGLAECRQVELTGEVEGGKQWGSAIGEGWEFRVMPIVGVPKAGSPAAGHGYSGWDLVVDRAEGGGYPDALLLATPPYGSLNEREIGTTYGLRAQDAIAWGPRRFHFLTSKAEWKRARGWYATVMEGAGSGGAGQSSTGQSSTGQGGAAQELLGLLRGNGSVASGQFEVLDARLVAGAADPPEFARQWVSRLSRVPHTVLQDGGSGAIAGPLGELRWIRFRVTLTLPAGWRMPAELRSSGAKCAE